MFYERKYTINTSSKNDNFTLHRLFDADGSEIMINVDKTMTESLTVYFMFQRRKEFESVNKGTTRCSISAIFTGRPREGEKEKRRERGTRKGRTGTKRNAIDGRKTIGGKDRAPLVHSKMKMSTKYSMNQFHLNEMTAQLPIFWI